MGNSYVDTAEQSKQSTGYVQVYSQLINMGFDENISLKAAITYPKNINKAMSYVENHQNPSETGDDDSKVDSIPESDFEDFEMPVFIKIPNGDDCHSDNEYHLFEYQFPISQKVFEEGRIVDLIMAATAILNQKMSDSGTEYQIMNPNTELISNSFCDITSHQQQLKYIKEFDRNDLIHKGLHLKAHIIGNAPKTTAVHNVTQFTIPIFIKTPNGTDHEYQLPLTNDQRTQVRVVDVLETAVELLNRNTNASGDVGVGYQILNPDQEMVLKSFCDIRSHDEQLKYLHEFSTDDIISKGLHLVCDTLHDNNTMGNDVALTVSANEKECENDVTKCAFILSLSKRLKAYNRCRNNENTFFEDIPKEQCTEILNEFHHILTFHDMNNDEYDYIFNECGGECALEDCNKMRRYYTMRTEDNDSFIKPLFDRIHAHIHHGYDTFRFTKEERTQMEQKGSDNYEMDITSHLKSRSTILKQKKSRFNSLIASSRFMAKQNKFSTNMAQMEQKPIATMHSTNDNDEKVNAIHDSCSSYSFSYNFNYFAQCKDSTQNREGSFIRDLYVVPRHDSLKHELLNNKIQSIPLNTWIECYMQCEEQMKSDQYKKITATFPEKGRSSKFHWDDHPIHFGYKEGDIMELKHLIAVVIYCGEDKLQRQYSETYRRLDAHETFEDVKERHSNYHHFAKTLKQAVEVFGTFYIRSTNNVQRFFHGINSHMLFDGMSTYVHTVLSTSILQNVAEIFATNDGLIVELVPAPVLKYFDVRWLSRYPGEEEFVFLGGQEAINVINIIHTGHYLNFKRFITALRLIDTMFDGHWYNDDATICIAINRFTQSRISPNPEVVPHIKISELGQYQDISPEIKGLTRNLLEHEAHRYKPDRYKKSENIPPYIHDLLHNICFNKRTVSINVKAMSEGLLEEYNLFGNGYIGYSFVKDFLCVNDYESVDLDFVHMLFPSCANLYFEDLSSIDSLFLDEILDFLSNTKSLIGYIELKIKHKLGWGNILQQWKEYKSRFNKVAFNCEISEDPRTQCKRLFICKQKSN